MIAVGIDSGLDGAIALVCSTAGVIDVRKMPVRELPKTKAVVRREVDARALVDVIDGWGERLDVLNADVGGVFVERIEVGVGGSQAMPRPGSAVLAAARGRAAGVVATVFEILLRRPVEIRAPEWKRFYGLGSDKHASVELVRRLYGAQIPRVFGHDKAEAVLIAHWALRVKLGVA